MGSLDDNRTFGFTHRIMLAAIGSLVGVVMLMVLLYLYARYLLKHQERRRRAKLYGSRTNQITPVDKIHVVEPPKSGLDPLTIASLPMFTYKATIETGRVDQNEDPTECSVCLGDITGDFMVRLLPNCKHIFHVQCIDTWLGSHTTCPICRAAAEPMAKSEGIELGDRVQPTAPPIEENSSRFGSFRWMLKI